MLYHFMRYSCVDMTMHLCTYLNHVLFPCFVFSKTADEILTSSRLIFCPCGSANSLTRMTRLYSLEEKMVRKAKKRCYVKGKTADEMEFKTQKIPCFPAR
jgi:hypothetical protein